MIILGLETSTMIEGVAVVDDTRILAEHRTHVGSTHAERLMPVILQTFSSAGLSIENVEGIAISIGPGSFTGLRIGLSTAKGLSLAQDVPLVAVPTLDGLANPLPYCQHRVCPILDAKRHEVYTALYSTIDGVPKRLTDFSAVAPDTILSGINTSTVFLGDGLSVYRELIEDRLGSKAHFAPPHLTLPSGSSIALLGYHLLTEGKFVDVWSIEPLYIRKSDAELKREQAKTKSV